MFPALLPAAHGLTHSLTHSLMRNLTHKLPHNLTHSLPHRLTRGLPHNLPHGLTCNLPRGLPRPPALPSPAPHRAASWGVPRPSGGRGSLPLWQRLAVAGVAAGAAGAGWLYLREEKERRRRARRRAELRAAALGRGHFQLVDHGGRPRSPGDFRGHWVLLYFGFTHCPDICPEALERLSGAVHLLDEDEEGGLPPVQPLFITVDPRRDDVAAVGRYVAEFHPRLLGLTGSPEEVGAAGRAFRVFAQAGPEDEEGGYLVDHSTFIYLVGPDGLLHDYYGRGKTPEQIARSVQQHMRSYEPLLDDDEE